MTIRKYRKKPVVIEAVQWTGENMGDILGFFGGCALREDQDIIISTLEGEMRARPGDWIIKGVKGEHYPIKDEIFRETYEAAEALALAAEAAAVKVKPLVWEESYYVVHASGSIEFFKHESEAASQADFLGRDFYVYGQENAFSRRCGDRLSAEYGEWVSEEQENHDQYIRSYIAEPSPAARTALADARKAGKLEGLREAAALVETAQWARNRLEAIADESWKGDARDFKRSLIGVFADFDEALEKCGSASSLAARVEGGGA